MVAADRLCYIVADLAELAIVKDEHDELGENAWLFEDERHKFDERYTVLAREKSANEDQVATLDREVDRLSQQVQRLEANKETLEGHLR